MEEMLTTLNEAVGNALAALESAVNTHGQAGVDLVLTTVRVQAFGEIAAGIVAIVILVVSVIFGLKMFRHHMSTSVPGMEIATFIAMLVSGGFGIIAIIVICNTLFDPFAWAAVFGYPELTLVNTVLQKL
jgi:hypothetical protein